MTEPCSRLPRDSTLLVDASSYVFRAWFGVPDVFHDSRGRPVNAVVGFARTLATVLEEARPARVAVAFDTSLFRGFRHRIDPGYKADRVLPDAALAHQLDLAQRLVAGLGMTAVASREYEADDLLASLARREFRRGGASIIASEDKDLAQALASPADRLWQVARGRVLDADGVEALMGVAPGRLAEWQALVGDPVDGIPGVPGIGPRTATLLLQHCGHVRELLARPASVAALPLRSAERHADALAAHVDRVRLNLKLTRLAVGVRDLPPRRALAWSPPEPARVGTLMRRLGLPAGSARHFHALRTE